jgi:Lrp/AsnC family transcriptional regulator, regulator for asnA, asnC and gidA
VRYRIGRLLENGVIKIKAIAIPQALNYNVIADVFIEAEPSLIKEVAATLAGFPCVSYVSCSIGERDISVQIIAHTNAEVYEFVTDTIGKVPGVRKTTTSIVPLTLKDVYDWRFPEVDCSDN